MTDLLIGDLFTDRVDKVWQPMESLYPADKQRLPTWTEGMVPERRNTRPTSWCCLKGGGHRATAIYRRRVEFAETDEAGMVHFSVFFRYMEEAEHAVWRDAGLAYPARRSRRPELAAHLRQFDFKSPLRFQDEFEVHTEIASISRSTIQWAHVITRGDTVIGTGTVTAIYVKSCPTAG